MPIEDIKPELDAWQAEAANAGVPARMTYSVIGQSAGGRDQYAVVINDLETRRSRPPTQTGRPSARRSFQPRARPRPTSPRSVAT